MKRLIGAITWHLLRRGSAFETIEYDVRRWQYHGGDGGAPAARAFARLFADSPDFRVLLYRRLGGASVPERLLRRALLRVAEPRESCYLDGGPIGEGLYLVHAFSTVLNAESIGRDCMIFHGVTLGQDRRQGRPTLGDRVAVYANASVIGGVTVGDDALIAAHALVLDDVPPRAVVGGVPAKIIKLRDPAERMDEL